MIIKNKLLGSIVSVATLAIITGCQADQTPTSPAPAPGYVITNNVKQPGNHIYVPAGRYGALGDSFSSGEGNPPFWDGTDTSIPLLNAIPGDKFNSDTCHRSDAAYSQILGTLHNAQPGTPKPSPKDFVACSGGLIQALFNQNQDNHGESPQADRLDSSQSNGGPVGLVTMSMGGNNVGFADIINGCVWKPPELDLNIFHKDKVVPNSNPCSVDDNGKPTEMQHTFDVNLNYIDGTRAENSGRDDTLEQTYVRLRNAAGPTARILIVGYPREFPQTPVTGCQSIDVKDQTWANEQLTGRLDDVIMSNIKAANARYKSNIEYVDTIPVFLPHPQCYSSSAFNGFNDSVMAVTDHSGYFHPTHLGNQLIGQAIMACLGQLQMECGMPAPSNVKSPPVPTLASAPVRPAPVKPQPGWEGNTSPSLATPTPTPSSKAVIGCSSSDADTFLQFMKDQGVKVKDALGPPECLDGYAEEDFTFTDTSPTANYPTFFFQKDSSPAGWKLLGGGAVGDASSICQALPAKVRTAFTPSAGILNSGCPVG